MNASKGVRALVLLALCCLAAGCSSHASEQRPASRLTEAQRDTAIARSQLPGAAAVGRALDLNGREAARAAQMDTLQGR
jgi:hypothetical protein